MILNGIRTLRAIRTALASSHWSPEKLRHNQFRQLKALLDHAYSSVPFYKQHYDQHGFHPGSIRTLEDVTQIPPLEKRHLRETPSHQLLSSGIRPADCLTIRTSGSTGSPLSIQLAEAGQRAQRVSAWRILFEHGFRWTDHTLEIRITLGPTHPVQRFGVAPKTWLSALDSPESWARVMVDQQPNVLVACPSVLRALAEVCPALTKPPRLIFSDTETLYPADRAYIQQKLASNPIDIYGLVELSNFAWECQAHQGFHTSADTHIVELIDSELIVTHLDQTDMPIIRYRTGDLAEWSGSQCGCGRTLPLLSHIHGRALDSVLLPSGRTLFWIFFHEHLAQFPAIRQWRVVQNTADSISVQLACSPDLVAPVEQALSQHLPEPLNIDIEAMECIPLAPGEKFRAVLRSIKLK